MSLGKSDPPPPPDYVGAANATAAGNLDAARVAAKANRVSQYTPYGNLIYTPGVNGDPDQWRADTILSPAQQSLLDSQNRMSQGLAGVGEKGVGYVQNMLDRPLDTSNFVQVGDVGNAGRDAITASILERMQPSLDRQRQLAENNLLIQGHNRGGEAWKATQDAIARAENDARLAAIQQGGAEQSRLVGLQQAERQRQLSEAGYLRNEPLNTLNAVRTGAQVTNPSWVPVAGQQVTQGPNLLGAAQSKYQSELANVNAQNQAMANLGQGLFSLGAAKIRASDRRLKSNIKRIGTHPLGIGIYSYEIFGRPDIGVMADEVLAVKPSAVHIHPSGYMMVDYGSL